MASEIFDLNTVNQDIEKLRNAISDLKEEAHWLESSRKNKSDMIKLINREVDHQAAKGEPVFVRRLFAEMNPFKDSVGSIGEGSLGVDLGPMLCALLGDHIKRRATDIINALDYEAGPPEAERARLLQQNAEQLLQLETAEEELICEAERQGWFIERRPDVRPEIFLEWVG